MTKPIKPKYVIRRATSEGDLGAIAYMNAVTVEVDIPDMKEGVWRIVWCGKKFAGFCGINPPVGAGRPSFLVRAGVMADHRGHGLQKRLIDVRLKYARKMGWKRACTYTLCTNAPSANSLINRGFKVYNPPYKWGSDNNDVIYWIRDV